MATLFTRRLRDVEVDAGPRGLDAPQVLWIDGGQAGHDVHESGANPAVQLPAPVEVLVVNDESINKNPPRLAFDNVTLIERYGVGIRCVKKFSESCFSVSPCARQTTRM